MARRLIGVDHANHLHETLADNEEELGYRARIKWDGDSWHTMQIYLQSTTGKKCAELQATQMPGCCAIIVVAYVHPGGKDCEPQETFDWALQIVERAAKDAAFGSAAMTQVVPPNAGGWGKELWIRCLEGDRGWRASKPFINGKSGNRVVYLTKDLGQDGKMAGFEKPIYA